MQVLLIDDERAIRRALREILEFEGCVVDEAENGPQALDILKSKTYDLLFSDIKMPQMDGLELLDQILGLGIETPVIMISGHGTVETAVGAIKKGAFDFIEKPLDLNRILVLLRQVKDRNLLVQETKQLKQVVKKIKGSAIIGESPEIEAIKTMIEISCKNGVILFLMKWENRLIVFISTTCLTLKTSKTLPARFRYNC